MNSDMKSYGEKDMNDNLNSQDTVVKLVKQAKRRPLPRSTKVLFYIVILASIFTGGVAYGKHKATGGVGSGLSLSALSAAGGAGGFGGGFGGGRIRGTGANGGAPGTGTLSLSADAAGAAAGTTTTAVAADVAGTVVSITAKSVVIATLSGGNETFPITDTTKVRSSAKMDLSGVKVGDIVTIKPDESAGAKTIMVVK